MAMAVVECQDEENEILTETEGELGLEEDGAAACDKRVEEMSDEEVLKLHREQEDRMPGIECTVNLVYSRNLAGTSSNKELGLEDQLARLTHVRLDRERIENFSPECSELLSICCTHLYLQRNRIASLQSFSNFLGLRFATFASNRLTSIEGMRGLDNLIFLDVSDNQIADIPPESLPFGLQYFTMRGNPCSGDEECKWEVIASLPKLKELDGDAVTRKVRTSARAALGLDVIPDKEQSDIEEEDDGDETTDDEGDKIGEDSSVQSAKRESHAAAAIKEAVINEEIELLRAAAFAVDNSELLTNTIKTSVLNVQQSAKRFIHNSHMRTEDYKQSEAAEAVREEVATAREVLELLSMNLEG